MKSKSLSKNNGWIQAHCIAVAMFLFASASFSQAATAFDLTTVTYSQDFDAISGSQTASIPTGWAFDDSTIDFATATTSTTQWAGTTGTGALTSTSGGGAYLFYDGVRGTATDKSIGYLSSGSFVSPRNLLFGFTNLTGGTITDLSLGWDYEKYRDGTRAWEWNFYYSADGTSWTPLAGGDQNYAGGAANTVVNPATQVTKSSIDINGLSVANGTSYYLRWEYIGTGGSTNAQALGVDDFSLTATISGGGGSNVSIGAGTTFTPTSFGGAVFTAPDTAVFDGTAGTIDLDGTVEAGGLNFTADGYTLAGTSGNTIATPTVAVASGATAEISGQITGNNGLVKTGSGNLILSGSNDFVGIVNIATGTLSISDDSNLGNTENDVTVSATLRTTNDVSLAAGRTVTGNGVLDIAATTTLAISGTFNTTGVTLTNTGTLSLQGDTRNVGNLAFTAAGTVDGNGPIFATGLLATTLSSGTATVLPAIDFGSVNRTVDVGAGGTVLLSGDLTLSGGGSTRLIKTGAGILDLTGNNSGLNRVSLGVSASTDGGRLRIYNNTALGSNQLFFNYGTLEAMTELTGINSLAIGLSIGGRTGAEAVLAGENITFTGSSNLFETAGQQVVVRVNNVTTLEGIVSTGSTATGLTITGTGTLRVDGSGAGVQIGTLVTGTATLSVNGQWGSTTAATITVDADAILKGSGAIAGAVTIAGTHAVGNSVGTQEVQNGVSYLNGSTFEWELTGNADTGPGTNFDQLIVSGGDINITDVSTLELVFNSAGSTVEWTDPFWNSDHTWTIADMTGAGSLLGMFTLSASSTWFDFDGDLLSAIRATADFDVAAGGVGGQSVILTYTAVVPEPSTCVLLLGGLGVIGWATRRRRI